MNGIKYSNTKFLEDHFGWYGILIEATPKLCNPLQNSGRNRSIKICAAICEGDNIKYSIHGLDEVNGIVDEQIVDHFGKYLKNNIEIKCQRFDTIFRKYNVKEIDFFSLDVEGAEIITLRTFDWSIPVHYWFVEIIKNFKNIQYVKEIEELFFKHKYLILRNVSKLHGWNTCFYLPKFPYF